MGVSFEVRVSGFDERVVKEAHPPKLVAMLAFGKAMAVGDRLREEYGTVEETVIIGADTLVWADGEAIGKPENLDEARVILNKLRGKFHDYKGIKVMPTFHPAYLLRDPSKKRETWEDLKKVRDYLESTATNKRTPDED